MLQHITVYTQIVSIVTGFKQCG